MDMMLFGPELFYLGMALVFFCLTLRRQVQVQQDYQIALALSAIGVLVTGYCLFQQGDLFFKAYRVDLFSQIFKFALALGLFLVLTISHNLAHIEERYQAEFYLFLTTTTIGMMMLVSSVELLTIYVALELSSYSLYILVPLRRGDGIDVEAGIKYLFIGAVSSGFMLFGLSYIFGATGSTYLVDILPKMTQLVNSPIGIIGILLAMAGFFFKLSVFPFHFWAPDVYQGGANQVVTFIATASKAAAVALLLRLAVLGQGSGYNFTVALVILSVVSMTLGNLVAIVQKDFKRMLAYSSIAHAGVFLMGVLTITEARLHRRHLLCPGLPGDELHRVHGALRSGHRRPGPEDRRIGRALPPQPLADHEPDPGDLRPGGRAALHRLHREIAHFHFGHERRLLLAGPDRRGERHHLPLLLSESHLCRLLHR